MSEEKEVRKITVGLILSWIFGVLFLLTGVGTIAGGSPIAGMVIIICSAMIIPYFNKFARATLHFEISGGMKFLLVIVIFVAMGFGTASSVQDTEVDQSQIDGEPGPTATSRPTPAPIPDIDMSPVDVMNVNANGTDYQWKQLKEDMVGKRLVWQGTVSDVKEDTAIIVKFPEAEDWLNTVYVRTDSVGDTIASRLAEGDPVTVEGRITRVSRTMGSVWVRVSLIHLDY